MKNKIKKNIEHAIHVLVHQKIIKRDRFSLLLKFLHLNDNSKYVKKSQEGHDPLFKVRPFFDPLIKNFQLAYHPIPWAVHRRVDDWLQGQTVLHPVPPKKKQPSGGWRHLSLQTARTGTRTTGGCTQVCRNYKTPCIILVCVCIQHTCRKGWLTRHISCRDDPRSSGKAVGRTGGQRSSRLHGQLL